MTDTTNTSKSEELSESAQRIVEIATGLFADFGYEGVSTRQLASAVGLSIATVNYHVGSKRELYEKVIRRLGMQEAELVHGILERFRDGVNGGGVNLIEIFRALVTDMVDLSAADPVRARLYMRRWLEPDDELANDETQTYLSLYKEIKQVVDAAKADGRIRRDFDFLNMMRSFDWMIYGYFVSGAPDMKKWRTDPVDKKNVRRFKAFLLDYVTSMTGLEEGKC